MCANRNKLISVDKTRQEQGRPLTASPHSHCYGDEQHVEALEDHVSTVAYPDVSGENHQVEGTATHRREGAQCQLTPLVPIHLCEADTIGSSSTCQHNTNTTTENTSS